MTSEQPQHPGRFVTKPLNRPAVEVDCSTWGAEAGTKQRTQGRFVVANVNRPAVEVDCSGWHPPSPALVLTLQPDPTVDAVQLALGLFSVLDAVNVLDRALGGTGLTRVGGRQSNGTVTLVLAAEQQAGAVERLQQICEQLNHPTEPAALPLPAVVKSLAARVA